jgi:hypothetical protein
MSAADHLQLLVTPLRALCALVLAEAQERGLQMKRLRRRCRVEVELDHLPVAFVLVVEVVEDVEEPVLQRKLVRIGTLGDDACIGRRRVPLVDPLRPVVIGAAGGDRRAGEVQVIVEQSPREIRPGRRDLDDVRLVPRPAERDVGAAEHEIHVRGHVRLPVTARLLLLDEPHHRCIAIRKRKR